MAFVYYPRDPLPTVGLDADVRDQKILFDSQGSAKCPVNIPYLGGSVTITNPNNNVPQVWMTEDLAVTHFRDGTPIRASLSDAEFSGTYPDDDEKYLHYTYYLESDYDDNSRMMHEKYGFIYPASTYMYKYGLAPKGWHIPSKREWELLLEGMGNEMNKFISQTRSIDNQEAYGLWYQDGTGSSPFDPKTTNATGLTLNKTGIRSSTGSGYTNWGTWGSSTRTDRFGQQVCYSGDHGPNDIYISNSSNHNSAAIRCVKDPVCIDADGNHYETTTIDGLHWMAENLKTTTYNDGTDIIRMDGDYDAEWMDTYNGAHIGYRCEYKDDVNNDSDRVGFLYNGWTFRGGEGELDISANLAPPGWRIATRADYLSMYNSLKWTKDFYEYPEQRAITAAHPGRTSTTAAGVLNEWRSNAPIANEYQNIIQFDQQGYSLRMGQSGLNIRPNGMRYYTGDWNDDSDVEANLWTGDGAPEGAEAKYVYAVWLKQLIYFGDYFVGIPGVGVTVEGSMADISRGKAIRCCRDVDTVD